MNSRADISDEDDDGSEFDFNAIYGDSLPEDDDDEDRDEPEVSSAPGSYNDNTTELENPSGSDACPSLIIALSESLPPLTALSQRHIPRYDCPSLLAPLYHETNQTVIRDVELLCAVITTQFPYHHDLYLALIRLRGYANIPDTVDTLRKTFATWWRPPGVVAIAKSVPQVFLINLLNAIAQLDQYRHIVQFFAGVTDSLLQRIDTLRHIVLGLEKTLGHRNSAFHQFLDLPWEIRLIISNLSQVLHFTAMVDGSNYAEEQVWQLAIRFYRDDVLASVAFSRAAARQRRARMEVGIYAPAMSTVVEFLCLVADMSIPRTAFASLAASLHQAV